MNGSIRGLSRDILVQRIPCDALNVMTVFGNLTDEHTCASIVYTSDIVHATNHKVGSIGRPGEIVYLGTCRAEHMLRPPCLLILNALISKAGWMMSFGGNP